MKERPILFSAPMVRAILEGRKTQTRRVVKGPGGRKIENLRDHDPDAGYSGRYNDPSSWGFPFYDDYADAPLDVWPELCHIGQPGGRLYVRETWRAMRKHDEITPRDIPPGNPVEYVADDYRGYNGKTRTAIHMPRWASRIDLEVTGVQVERLQDISEEDALAEGIWKTISGHYSYGDEYNPNYQTARDAFLALWESINGPGSADADPWVWVVEFKRVKP